MKVNWLLAKGNKSNDTTDIAVKDHRYESGSNSKLFRIQQDICWPKPKSS